MDRPAGLNADPAALADAFESHRPRLRAVAYRMLGSATDAEDAVQDAWLRLSTSEAGAIENLGAWLTTVVSRIALNMLRARRREDLFEADLVIEAPDPDPAQEALAADAVGAALFVVLEQLSPAERLAFVLHDTFGLAFEQIAVILDRSPQAARQLATRARRRVRGGEDPDTPAPWPVIEAFMAAARDGDFDALLSVLDPDVVLTLRHGQAIHGARAVAAQAALWSTRISDQRRVRVNGAPGLVSYRNGAPFALMTVTVEAGQITALTILNDADRLRSLDGI